MREKKKLIKRRELRNFLIMSAHRDGGGARAAIKSRERAWEGKARARNIEKFRSLNGVTRDKNVETALKVTNLHYSSI